MNEDKSVRYHRLQRRAAVLSVIVQGAVLLALLATGTSVRLRAIATATTGGSPSSAATVAVFLSALLALLELTNLPLRFYRTFVLERRYGLSSESFRTWAIDHVKGIALSAGLALAAIEAVYFTMTLWPKAWWLASSIVFVAAGALLAQLAPLVLLPIFYRLKPLDRAALTARLVSLSARAGLPVLGVYEWGLGERTRRANAALVGTGATRRILLSDTLLAEYSDDEIEVILAHELGHHAHGDIRSGLFVEGVLVVITFAAGALALATLWPELGLAGPADAAGLPILILTAGIVSLVASPAHNALSRRNEYRADRFALSLTDRPDAFVSAMRRLGAQNLAEERPSTAARWFFHTHPPFDERIHAARRSDPSQ